MTAFIMYYNKKSHTGYLALIELTGQTVNYIVKLRCPTTMTISSVKALTEISHGTVTNSPCHWCNDNVRNIKMSKNTL